MSDSEEEIPDENEESEIEEEDENADGGDDGSEGDDAEKSQVKAKLKQEQVSSDISMLSDIFSYIDKTTKRVTKSLIMERTIQEQQSSIEELQQLVHSHREDDSDGNNGSDNYSVPPRQEKRVQPMTSSSHSYNDDVSISFSQYECLNEAQRAELLEKAINVLTKPQDHKMGRNPNSNHHHHQHNDKLNKADPKHISASGRDNYPKQSPSPMSKLTERNSNSPLPQSSRRHLR